ncbi:hypothetical protein ABEB36_006242 [Hypothenemus hampei]|uniref:Uncharacterized protein n=1 Tax=Hypothenemus hampei TaxID=57062 RepID=A0ABD1EPV2_HYPHA
MDFPISLVELSLRRTHVKNNKLFFHNSYSTMRNLKVLILDECGWLDSSFFMSVAKYYNLELLSIIKCTKLHINALPYLNVARHGCHKLKLIDCRFSTIAHDMLEQARYNIVALYVQSMSSYELDTSSSLFKVAPVRTTENEELISQSTVRDFSLERFRHLTRDLFEELPESLLYTDPYPECSCGWRDKTDKQNRDFSSKEHHRSMSMDDFMDFRVACQRFICRRHVKDLNRLPSDFKKFFYDNQKKFYPDSSDSSDSDDDQDCCMFGVGKSQMIVIKVREADEQGNIPQPEVINFSKSPSEEEPQPSTSNSSSSSSNSSNKRKHDTNDDSSDSKRQKHVENRPSTSRDIFLEPAGCLADVRVQAPSIEGQQRRSNQVRLIRNQLAVPRDDEKKLKLRRLSLRGYRLISDETLYIIRNLHLDLLDVTYTRVTKQGLEEFLTFNPNCRVVHENYCVCKPYIPY